MRIQFVTGKGGVGKSCQAAALALAHHRLGHRTILAELGDHSFYRDYFQMPTVDDSPRVTPFGFSVALWSGQSCLREYALHLLKVERLYKLFFENPISHALIQAAPALAELSILGKVTSGPPRNVGPKMPFDVVVVDGFASGHFAALLKAPQSHGRNHQGWPNGHPESVHHRGFEKTLKFARTTSSLWLSNFRCGNPSSYADRFKTSLAVIQRFT